MCFWGVMELVVVGVIGVGGGGASSESRSGSHWCHQVSSLSIFDKSNDRKASIGAVRPR